MDELTAAERRSQIGQMVLEHGKVMVSDLVEMYQVTETSIRRDLSLLEEAGRLVRIHGGAVPVVGNSRTDSFLEKKKLHIKVKEKIAAAAVELIRAKDILLLDSGTTTLQVVRYLQPGMKERSRVNLVTNSIPIAQEVLNWPSPNLTLLGGLFLADYQATVGPQTIAQLSEITADVVFLGTDGLTLHNGATTANILMSEIDRMMVERSRKAVLITDSSKIGRVGFVPVKPVNAFDVIITDSNAPVDFVEAVRGMGVEVILV